MNNSRLKAKLLTEIIAELRWPHTQMGKKGNPEIDFLMVIMASGIARGRVCTKAELPRSCPRWNHTPAKRMKDMQRSFITSFFGIGHPCYGQLTAVKTRYQLTSIT